MYDLKTQNFKRTCPFFERKTVMALNLKKNLVECSAKSPLALAVAMSEYTVVLSVASVLQQQFPSKGHYSYV